MLRFRKSSVSAVQNTGRKLLEADIKEDSHVSDTAIGQSKEPLLDQKRDIAKKS